MGTALVGQSHEVNPSDIAPWDNPIETSLVAQTHRDSYMGTALVAHPHGDSPSGRAPWGQLWWHSPMGTTL